MAEKYYSILTNKGKELEAASSASGIPVVIKDFVIGDGGGQAVTPDPARTTLVREVYRGAVSSLEVSPDQPNQWIAHIVIPADVGGFTMREGGLLTDAGELYSVANSAAIEKPESGININLQYRLAVSETASIELKVATGDGLFLRQDANLSDVKDKATSRKNLDLKGAALLDVGITAGTVAAGNDTRIVNALQKANNLSDLVDKAVARTNLGLGTAATYDVQSSGTDDSANKVLLVGAGGLLSGPIVQGVDTGDSATWPTQNSTRFLTYSPKNGDPARASIFLKDTIGGVLVEFLAPYSGRNGSLVQVRNSSAVFTLYSNLNKPTASDVGAYPITGGTLNGSVSTTGAISENGQRVYSPNNKPTAIDVGAYPDTGGTLHGNLSTAGTISENGQRVYSPNNKPSTASLAVNGWEKDLVTGVITQWGKGKYSDGQLVNFPIVFPNAAFAVTISSDPNDNPTLTELPQAYPVSNSQFRTGCATFSGGNFVASSLNCTWIAKGY